MIDDDWDEAVTPRANPFAEAERAMSDLIEDTMLFGPPRMLHDRLADEFGRAAKLLAALDYYSNGGQDSHVAEVCIAEYEANRG